MLKYRLHWIFYIKNQILTNTIRKAASIMKKPKDNLHFVPKEDTETLSSSKPDSATTDKPIKKESCSPDSQKEENLYTENALELSGLSFKETLAYKKGIRNKRLSTMNSKEKRHYLVHYYKWHFIGSVLCVLLLFWIGKAIYTANLPRELILAITNDGTNVSAEEYIPKAFRTYYNLDNKNVIQIFSDLTIDNSDNTAIRETTLTDYEKIIIYITSDKLDAIIGDEKTLNYYKSTGDIAILDACLDSELYEQIKDYTVKAEDETLYVNEGKPYTAAIDISDTEFARKCNLSYEKVYLMIPNNRYNHNEATINLIKLIFSL